MRRYKLYEMLLAERESGKREQEKETKRKRNRTRESGANLLGRNGKLEPKETGDMNFPYRLMYKKEIARECGVPRKVVYELIDEGRLQKIRLPGCRDPKYSPKQLEVLVKNYNKLF